METLNAVLLGLATLITALIVHQLLKPKAAAKKIDTKVFDSMLDDDGWAEEEEDEKKVAAKAAAPVPPSMPMPPSAPATPAPPMKVNEGPFNIGDRVILKNLVSAQELNGRHGVIADLWDKKTERYPVDLDLLDGTRKSPLSVKVGNMTKEPPILEKYENERVAFKDACVEESAGRAASFVFSALRGSLQNSLKGEKDPQKLAEFGWKFWNPPDGKGVYYSLKEFLTKGILEKNKLEELEKQLNAENPKGAYSKVSKAMTSELAVASWHIRVHGAFWIVGIGPEGTLVIPENNPRQVYCVLGFKMPLGSQGKFPRPPKFFLTILPWYGRLIHDPMLMTTTGNNQVELASPQLAVELVTACKLATQEGRVISRLAQLEVEGGSKEGVPYIPMITKAPQQMKFEPPTDQEKGMVESLAAWTLAADKQPTSVWNFIRSGNGNQVIIINGKGAKMGEFLAGAPEPTHLEIFESLLTLCEEKKERPRIVGVDTASACPRLQFLTQGVPGMTVAQVNVTRKPQQKQGS